MKYSYSSNGEEFQGMCDSIKEAISEACDDDDMAEIIYVGEANQKTIGEYLWQSDIENLLERLAEYAGEDCGECANDWLEGPTCPRLRTDATPQFKASAEQKAEYQTRVDEWKKTKDARLKPLLAGIKSELEKWATKNDEQPGFWHVSNVKEYDREGNRLAESI